MFFWLSKLIWMVISPDILLVLMISTGFLLLLAGAVKKAKLILTLGVSAMLIITFVPVGEFILAPLENRFKTHPDLPERVDGIIMLGGSEKAYLAHFRNQAELSRAAERYLGFIRLIRQYPDAIHLFAGGSGSLSHGEYKDADVARMVFDDLGVDPAGILFESRSRNTHENGVFSKAAVNPRPNQNWILVTTSWHLPRAVGVFEKIGWKVIPYPVDHLTHPDKPPSLGPDFSGHLTILKMAMREWVGLIAYYITGRTSSILPGRA
ncbi:YdcF family protein [Desulfospira joergensenii]|uniref:YdcF family protein n=1 Tax=Desulfospira joergensenii TaxID=53329 RepID=UPI0003B425F2|nr:YdcF family protein [Desulfospira joergensenii]